MSKSNETTPNVPTLRFDKLRDFHRQKLGTLCTIVGGYAFDSKKMMTKGNYQIVKMGNFYAGNLDLSRTPTFLDEPTPSELSALLKKHDIVITLTGTVNKKDYGYTVQINNEKNLLLNQRCALIRAKDSIDNNYLLYLLKSNEFLSQFYASSVGGTGNQTNVSIKAIEQFIVSIPHIDEQKRIGKFLSDIDKRIEIQNKIISDLKVLKKELNGFLISRLIKGKEPNCKIEDVIDYEQPTSYIVNSYKYIVDGKTPVLTANKAFFLGYTNEKEGIYNKSDCIIFDDFTLDFKYVDFPFKVKSSAIKILTAKKSIELRYFYEYLVFLNLTTNEHKRHYISEIATLPLYLPSIDEQRRVLSVLNAISSKITVEEKYKIALLTQKKYLLNAMFM